MKSLKSILCPVFLIALFALTAFAKTGTISTTKTGTISTTKTGTISTTAGPSAGRVGTISTTGAAPIHTSGLSFGDRSSVLELLTIVFTLW